MNDNILLDLIKKSIAENEDFVVSGGGESMRPFINPDTDKIVLSPIKAPLKKGDICLYMRGEKAVIHRIYDIKDGLYDMLGDGQFWIEKDVKSENIVAVATKRIRNGKELSLKKPFIRCFFHLKAIKKIKLHILKIQMGIVYGKIKEIIFKKAGN